MHTKMVRLDGNDLSDPEIIEESITNLRLQQLSFST